MKLTQIEIKHFGSLSQRTFSLPDQPIAVFYGPNEAGKSTTVSFISQILFGFRKLNESSPFFTNYRPLGHTSLMGGSLELVDKQSSWRLTRSWTKGDDSRRGGLTVMQAGQQVPAAVFFSQFKDIDYNFYVDNFIFNQDLLDQLGSLNQQDFLERIYYLGAAQSSDLLALRNQLQTEAGQIFKKTGRKPPLNQLLTAADAQQDEIAGLSDELATYQELNQQISKQQTQLQTGEAEAAKLQKQVNRLQALTDKLSTWQQYQQLLHNYHPVKFEQAQYEQAQTIAHQLQDVQTELNKVGNQQAATISTGQMQRQNMCLAKAGEVRAKLTRQLSLQDQIKVNQQQLAQLSELNPGLAAVAQLSEQDLQTGKKLTTTAAVKANWQLYLGGLGAGVLLALLAFKTNHLLTWILLVAGLASGGYGWYLKNRHDQSVHKLQVFCQQHHLPTTGLTTQLLTSLPQYRSLQAQSLQQQVEFDQLNQQLAKFQTELQQCFPEIDQAAELSSQLMAAEQIAAGNRQQLQAAEIAQQHLNALTSQAERLKLSLQQLLQAADVKTMEDYQTLHKKWLADKQTEAQLNGLQAAIADDQEQLTQLAARPVDLQHKLSAVAQNLDEQTKANNQIRSQLAELKVKQGQLASSQTKQAAEQNLSVTEGKILNLGKEYLADLLASKLIDAGLNYASSQRFPKMLVQAQHFFSLLTAGRYQQIKLGKKISVTRSDGKIRPVQYLSRATGEQLYFALKLAFVQQISDQINLPILIDDAFVNFDPERQSLIRQLLTSLSQTNQVIIFTAQPGLAKMLTDQPIMLQKEG
ncbi:MAG: AAA family ATPase [Lactobacillus sp.]|jgi:uncharacterized protein YhaN|nr:AAA family ATPase [Lactobacillus sp.]